MPKTIKCGFCGRENPIDYSTCSNCGLKLRKPREEFSPKKEQEKQETVLTIDEIEERMGKNETGNLDFWKPTDQKLMIFVSLTFTTLWLPLIVKYKLIFSILYYLTLYWFSCRWISKSKQFTEKSVWQDFIFQFILLVLAFFLSFTVLLP